MEFVGSRSARRAIFATVCVGFVATAAHAQTLLRQPDLQGPVRAAGGDLLLLAGIDFGRGDSVTFRPLDGGETQRVRPIPEASDDHAIVVRVPREIDAARPYRIEVMGVGGGRGLATVNDARPLWFLPRTLPASGSPAGLEREIKIVGRNLARAAGTTAVRLRGPREVALEVLIAAPIGLPIDEFVVRARVPDALPRGDYRVEVSRDAGTWVAAPDMLRIAEPRPVSTTFDVADPAYGGCRPDDERDDARCIAAAIHAAGLAAARGADAVVRFGPGTWLIEGSADKDGRANGLIVPRGVTLLGANGLASRLQAGAPGRPSTMTTLFTLTARNRIADIAFEERGVPDAKSYASFVRLGRRWNDAAPDAPPVRDITIDGNTFQGRTLAIADGGGSIHGLVVTRNRFRARRLALSLTGDWRNPRTFRIEDAIVTGNLFEPGSYLDLPRRQGAIAAEIGAGDRFDFSDNVADGASTAGLDSPSDARGWRAAFFWHQQGPQERVLISGNDIRCSGDKAGDGEAISLDGNHNTFAFDDARAVLDADADTVAVAGRTTGPARDWRGHWLQIAAGPGVGQSRRIVDVVVNDAANRTSFQVSPAWDAIPSGGSRVTVGRAFWQTLIVGNLIDERAPLCQRSNRTKLQGGVISVWGPTTDSVVAFNRQLGTSGIVFQQRFAAPSLYAQYFLDIRGNEIDGVYDSRRGLAGIQGSHGAAPDREPPVASFGVTISGNDISLGREAGQPAISFPLTWHRGPAPHRARLIDRPLIFGNRIGGATIEIAAESLVARAVLSGNTCANVAHPRRAEQARALAICSAGETGTCECPGR